MKAVYETLKEKYLETHPALIQQLKARAMKGYETYGKHLYYGDVDISYLQEEILDAIMYAESLKLYWLVDKLINLYTMICKER